MKTSAENKSLIKDFASLKLLWPYIRPYKLLFFISVTLIPILSALQAYVPLIIKNGIDKGVLKEDFDYLTEAAIFYAATIVALYFIRTIQSFVTSIGVYRMVRDLRNKLMNHVLQLNSRFHDKSLSGALTTRATSDFDNLSESLNMGVISSIVDFAVLGGCVIGMYTLDAILATAALVMFPIVSFVVTTLSKQIKKAMLSARKKIAALNGFAQECLYGSRTIKLLTAEEEATKKFDELNIGYRNAQMKSVIYDAVMFSIIDGISSIAIGFTLWIAVGDLLKTSGITAGILVAFVQYLTTFFEPIKQLGSKIAMLQGAFTAIDRIFGLMEKDEFISGNDSLGKLEGKITFDDVSFSYENGESKKILDHISFNLTPGASLALVGTTGSGKSTIIKLLCKLYDGYEGDILIDGQEIRSLSGTALRKQIAIVPQDLVIFEGTIAFNISLGDPTISKEAIIKACESVGADKFINTLPDAYETHLKEQGTNLSHGQRQLLAFARALVRNPEILVLDEATSSVDPESEQLIQTTIDKIIHDRTVIIVAHRLSTIKSCDKILVIDKGHIIEQGSHDELIALTNGSYAQLYNSNYLAPPS